MTIFEVVDAAGVAHLVDAANQYITEDERGRMRHDFVGIHSQEEHSGLVLPTVDRDDPLEISFTNPQSVREVAP